MATAHLVKRINMIGIIVCTQCLFTIKLFMCKGSMANDITLCLEIWIKFRETSSALGGIFAVLYIQSCETLRLLDKDISFLKGDSF